MFEKVAIHIKICEEDLKGNIQLFRELFKEIIQCCLATTYQAVLPAGTRTRVPPHPYGRWTCYIQRQEGRHLGSPSPG